MIKVNLVPAELLAKAHQKQQLLQAGAAGVAALIVLVLISLGHYYTLEKLQHQYAQDDARLKKLQVIVAQVEELEKTEAALKARLGVITDLLKGRTTYPYLMSDVAKSVPGGIRLKTLTATGGGSSVGAIKLNFTAEAQSNDDIAAWLRKMDGFGNEPKEASETRNPGKFGSIELGAVTSGGGAPGSPTAVYNFSVTATYTPSL
jgi:Tfp pilus assembly protein PilN